MATGARTGSGRASGSPEPRKPEPLGAGARLVGRYELTDLVADSPGTTLWRGTDPVLNRDVAIRLVAPGDPRVEQLRQTARAAALVNDRRVVHVLDVIDTPDGGLAVVTEWITGRNLATLAREPMAAQDAAAIALELARALQSAHAVGIAHGRILPSSVIITDNGPRLRGLGVDAVLFGVLPGHDPRRADLHGVGAVLHAALTAKWPGPVPPGGPADEVDGMPVSPMSGHRRLTPARLVAGVPRVLDEFVACSLVDARPPRGREVFPNFGSAVAALTIGEKVARPATPLPERPRQPHQRRTRTLAIMAGVVTAVLLAGVGLYVMSFGPPSSTARAHPNNRSILFSPVKTKVAVPTSSAVPSSIPVVGIQEFNPFGHGTESTDPVTLAIDGDPVSAWHTATYRSATLDGKQGVGLLLDLGAQRPVSAVDLLLVGNGTDLSLYGGNSIPGDPTAMNLVLKVSGAGTQINLRSPSPVSYRYLLIWLTKLPVGNQGYQGGVAEVTVQG